MTELERVRAIVADVHFPGYTFAVVELAGEPIGPPPMIAMAPVPIEHPIAVQVAYNEPDVMTGVVEEQRGRLWVINHAWGAGQIVQTCLKALLTSLEHRAREHLLWRGRPVLQPHFSLDELWKLAAPREHEGNVIPF